IKEPSAPPKDLRHGTSYTSSPTRRDKDRCDLPLRRLAPASGLPLARARSDIGGPFVGVPVCVQALAQSQVSAGVLPPRAPQQPRLAQLPKSEKARAVAAAAPAAVHPAGFAHGRDNARFRCQCASSYLRTG